MTQESDGQSQRSDRPRLRLRVDVFDDLMAKRGVHSVVEQARLCGTHRANMFRVRAGQGGVTLQLADAMAEACGASIEDLFERVAA